MRDGPVEARGLHDGRPLVHVHLKVVPGAAQAGIAGAYGDRLKVRVSAPAESGKANRAVLALLAGALGIPAQDLALARGAGNPRKTVAVSGLTSDEVARRLLP